jgi:DNA polymerase III epsilon subunit-like protein
MAELPETYISVDVETAGPAPGTYSMLSIGACTVYEPQSTFYVELQPVNENKVPSALIVGRLNWGLLKKKGLPPKEAMTRFARWITEATPEDGHPVFLAFNAPFDWMFINEYFHRYLGYNPFGYKALDIKAFYMGLHGVTWEETGMRDISPRYLNNQDLTHHALRDALDQAEIFRKMLAEAQTHHKGDTE